MAQSIIIVDSAGFARSAGRLVGVAAATKSLKPRLRSLADMASRVQCGDQAEAINRVIPIVNSVDGMLRALAVVMRERARWAEMAARNPSMRSNLDLILRSRHGFEFLLMSAVGDAEGLRKMASEWHMVVGNTVWDRELLALKALIPARANARFDKLTAAVDVLVEREAGVMLQSPAFKRWGPQGMSVVLATLGGFAADQASNKALKMLLGNALGKQVGTGVGELAGPALSGVIAGLIELWADSKNPYLSAEQRAQRAAATAATAFAVSGVAMGAGALCIALTAGLGTIACVGGVIAASAVAGHQFGKAIDEKYGDDRHRSEKFYRNVAKEARQGALDDHIYAVLRHYNPQGQAMTQFPMGTPEYYKELDRLQKLYTRQAKDEFYRDNRYPPKDKIDDYLLHEQDRAGWHAKEAEISLNQAAEH